MAKVLMVVAQHGFRDEEYLVTREVLATENHSVKVASLTRGKAKGMLGAEVVPDMAAHEANPDFFDAVVIIGGQGAMKLAESPDVIRLVQGAFAKGKVLAAICIGPITLAKAGVLSGKRATVFRSPEDIRALKEGGALYTGEDVAVDEKLVTACGPHAAGDFGRKLCEMLKE